MKQFRIAFFLASSLSLAACSQNSGLAPSTNDAPIAQSGGSAQRLDHPFFRTGKVLGLATVLYCAANNDHFPVAKNGGEALKLVKPYVSADDLKSASGAFEYNAAMSGVATPTLSPAKTGATVVWYQAKSDLDGQRCVVFADAHCKMVGQEEWLQLKPKRVQ